MENLKRLALSFTLLSILAVAAFGGEIPSPPCAPGETQGPACSQSDGSTDPGETSGPPASAVDLTTIVEALELALSLY